MNIPDGGAAAKKAFRGPASACLSLEAVIVPLGPQTFLEATNLVGTP